MQAVFCASMRTLPASLRRAPSRMASFFHVRMEVSMRSEWTRLLLCALAATALVFAGPVGCGSDDDDDSTAPGMSSSAPTEPGPTEPGPTEPGPTEPGPTGTEAGNIIDVATEAGAFGTLLAALEAAELTEVLEGEGPFTVFAPTDAAFEALLVDLGIDAAALLANEDLAQILLYHVISGAAVASADVSTGPVATAAELTAWITVDGGVMVNGATVDTPDVMASNGVIHIVDSVIMPADIAEIAGYTGVHSSLVAALGAADLVGAVTDTDAPVTVFAPTDDAFSAALTALGLTFEELAGDVPTLATILTYHVLDGEVLSGEVVDLAGESIEMLSGELAEIDAASLTIAGAALNAGLLDIRTTSGVIHVLDDVMVPPSLDAGEPMSIVDVAREDGRFTILLQALETAELEDVLADLDGTFTVFAPTDDAFADLLEELEIDAEALLAREDLATILLYHVISGAAVMSDAVTTGPALTAADLSVWLNAEAGVAVNEATVIVPDVGADNGVIHAIDTVILPANIATFAQFTGVHTSLVQALIAADLVGDVTENVDPVTVFAPTDDAFAAALIALDTTFEALAEDLPLLTTILTYHVFDGEVFSEDVVALDGQSVEMLSTESALIDADALTIGGAGLNADLLDIRTTSGVIHVLNDVMVPPSIVE
ncbi:MAG: fasciclin domain-containing protein [Deltaproteobacteria bacterium]|nr:MAG: fasciclin domain-containing protein [Deltaproteobacteria bacterium]